MDTRTDYSVFRTSLLSSSRSQCPSSRVHDSPNYVACTQSDALSLLDHPGLPWAWLMQLKQLISLAATVAKDGANHRSLAPSCNPAHLTRSNAGAPAELAKELSQLCFETYCSVCLDALTALSGLSANQLTSQCSSFDLLCTEPACCY